MIWPLGQWESLDYKYCSLNQRNTFKETTQWCALRDFINLKYLAYKMFAGILENVLVRTSRGR